MGCCCEIMNSKVNAAAILSDALEISREELRQRLHDPSLTIVDVLPAESYAVEHIPGALSIPLELVGSHARQLLPDRAAEIVVYCGKLTCDRSPQAQQQLKALGYSNVREYRAGLADWIESREPTERVAEAASKPDPGIVKLSSPPLSLSLSGEIGRGPARLSRMRLLDNSVLDLIQRRSTLQLFLIWIGMILLCGVGYWIGALVGEHGLIRLARQSAPI